jgi:hypothetical protein
VTLGIFLANSARIGAMKRHGPHHEAVKSTTTYQSSFLCYGIEKTQEILNRTKAKNKCIDSKHLGLKQQKQIRQNQDYPSFSLSRNYICNKATIKRDNNKKIISVALTCL